MVSSIFISLMVLAAWSYRLHATREEIRDANGDLYLTRYFIWKPRNKKFGRIYLHHIIRSDHDRALHDHPWGFVSLIQPPQNTKNTPISDGLGAAVAMPDEENPMFWGFGR